MQTDCKKSPCTGDEADKGIPPVTYWPQPPRLPWARPLQLGGSPLSVPADSLGGRGRHCAGPGGNPRERGELTGTPRRSTFRESTMGGLCPALHPGTQAPLPGSGPPQALRRKYIRDDCCLKVLCEPLMKGSCICGSV
ncbi:uncharacterized protein WM277_015263 isoform 2-T2 [Molossus nigricans]